MIFHYDNSDYSYVRAIQVGAIASVTSIRSLSSSIHNLGEERDVGHGVMRRRIDPSWNLIQPVFHNWCAKGCHMCYPVCVGW